MATQRSDQSKDYHRKAARERDGWCTIVYVQIDSINIKHAPRRKQMNNDRNMANNADVPEKKKTEKDRNSDFNTVVVSEGEEVLGGQSSGELVVRSEMLGQAVNQNHQRPENARKKETPHHHHQRIIAVAPV